MDLTIDTPHTQAYRDGRHFMSISAEPLHQPYGSSRKASGECSGLILPSDAGYDEARLAWNRSADQCPAAIWRARSVEGVQDGLGYARERGWRVTAQTTGHYAQILPDLSDALLLKLAARGDFDLSLGWDEARQWLAFA